MRNNPPPPRISTGSIKPLPSSSSPTRLLMGPSVFVHGIFSGSFPETASPMLRFSKRAAPCSPRDAEIKEMFLEISHGKCCASLDAQISRGNLHFLPRVRSSVQERVGIYIRPAVQQREYDPRGQLWDSYITRFWAAFGQTQRNSFPWARVIPWANFNVFAWALRLLQAILYILRIGI